MKIFGILNITPDSFSDGGENFSYKQAITKAYLLLEQGADVIDIGGQSTRPNAVILTAEQEWQRVSKIIAELCKNNFVLSLDSYHVKNQKKAADLGVKYINDVNGFADPKMQELALNTQQNCVVMHSLTVPADKKIVMPKNLNVTQELINWGQKKVAELTGFGIKKEKIILDTGIGFGKTTEQSWQLINDAKLITKAYKQLGVKTFYGHSRKSFISVTYPQSDLDLELSLIHI